jgi:hypothetical protein
MNNRLFAALCACALAASTAGCSVVESAIYGGVNSAASSAGQSAGQNIGNEAGNRAGNAAINAAGGPTAPVSANPNLSALNARMTMVYTQIIFSMAFNSGGYAVSGNDFKPGQFVRYSIASEDRKGSTLERAYLGDDAEGNQWWKVKMVNPEKPGDTVILEALLSPKDQKLQRLRGQFPGETEGKEMAVTEGSGYVPPTRLTKGSIEGATKGVENVTVPAGSFSCKHVVFGDIGSTHEWWLSDKVPGGTVKESTKGNGGSQAHTLELLAFGNDAKSELGTKLK